MVIIAFRKETDRLASICSKTFSNVAKAKNHMEDDAAYFCTKHSGSINWVGSSLRLLTTTALS